MSRIGVSYTNHQPNRRFINQYIAVKQQDRKHSPNIPVGATIVSSPKTVLHVPAMSLKLGESPEVIGAGSKALRLSCASVMCELEDLGEPSKEDMVKLMECASGSRTSWT